MKTYDIAAYIWPAYTGDEPRTRMFWPLQKAIVQAILQKRSAVIPVPVVDEYIHPVVGRGRDRNIS